MSAAKSPRVIAISSGKGGVGKTFFSVHLAARAAASGQRVLLMDADLGLANVDVMLGLKTRESISRLIDGECTLQDIIVPARQGFDVIPGGSGLSELTSLSAAKQQMILDTLRDAGSRYDLVIVDTAAGIGDNVLYFVSASETALIVLTPDPTSLTDAYALIKVLSQQRDVRRFQVVINQTDELEGQITFRRLLSVTDRYLDVFLDYIGNFPASPAVRQAIQRQQLLDEKAPEHVADNLNKVLDSVLARPRDTARGGLQFFWEHALSAELDPAIQLQGGSA